MLTTEPKRRVWTKLLVIALAAVTFSVTTSGEAEAAGTKTLGGQIHCPGTSKIESIWMLGDSSGWHGHEYETHVYYATYEFEATKGERIQVWLNCTGQSEQLKRPGFGRDSFP